MSPGSQTRADLQDPFTEAGGEQLQRAAAGAVLERFSARS